MNNWFNTNVIARACRNSCDRAVFGNFDPPWSCCTLYTIIWCARVTRPPSKKDSNIRHRLLYEYGSSVAWKDCSISLHRRLLYHSCNRDVPLCWRITHHLLCASRHAAITVLPIDLHIMSYYNRLSTTSVVPSQVHRGSVLCTHQTKLTITHSFIHSPRCTARCLIPQLLPSIMILLSTAMRAEILTEQYLVDPLCASPAKEMMIERKKRHHIIFKTTKRFIR